MPEEFRSIKGSVVQQGCVHSAVPSGGRHWNYISISVSIGGLLFFFL